MHSNRIRTARSLSFGGGGSLSRRGGLCPGGFSVQRGEGVSVQGRCLSRGSVSVNGRNMGPETETPWKEHGTRQSDRKGHHTETPLDRMKDVSKNITLPQTSFVCSSKLVIVLALLSIEIKRLSGHQQAEYFPKMYRTYFSK